MAAPKKYSDELRERATRLALESGRAIAHVAQDLGVHKEALRRWVRQAKADAAGGTPSTLSSVEREELKRLRGEVRELGRPTRFSRRPACFSRQCHADVRARRVGSFFRCPPRFWVVSVSLSCRPS